MKNIPLLLNHCSEMFSLWHNKELSVRAADKIKRQYFLERKYLGSKDRKFIENLYFDMIRNLRLYQWQIKQNEAFHQETTPPELITVHAFMRRFGKNEQIIFNVRDKISEFFETYEYQDIFPDEPEIRCSLPDCVWERIRNYYSQDELEACLEAMLESPGVHIRTNTLKINTPQLMQKLDTIPYRLGELSPDAIRLEKYGNLEQNPSYKKGYFDMQDESSQLVALACNPRPTDLVIDLCAGAGGKTLHLAALQGDTPKLIASDKYPSRLKELIIRAKRLGIRNIQLTPLEKIRSIYQKKADILLIDAPCSGTGVYGRHPDRKWELNSERLDRYVEEQRQLLTNNATLVKPGGVLVYATCSIIPDENILQVENFLEHHADFELISVYDDLRDHAVNIQADVSIKYLQILPHHYNSDGFFIAKLKRNIT